MSHVAGEDHGEVDEMQEAEHALDGAILPICAHGFAPRVGLGGSVGPVAELHEFSRVVATGPDTSALEEDERTRRSLELAGVTKDRLPALSSHEPRNPLASIASSAELLQPEPIHAAGIARMLDRFSQAPGALDRASADLGNGLLQARSIIEMHDGWISASSPGPGKGSPSKVGVPIRHAGMLPPAEPVPDAQASPQDSTRGLLVLIADDNADAAWGLARLLELSGFRTLLASGGEEALRLGRRERPPVMVLDIGMPDLSGHEVARRVRAVAWGRETVLIAATGWGQEADLLKSSQAGFDAHLTKPLNLRKLKEVITEQLARRRIA